MLVEGDRELHSLLQLNARKAFLQAVYIMNSYPCNQDKYRSADVCLSDYFKIKEYAQLVLMITIKNEG